MPDLLDILADLLTEFNLPEPEVGYSFEFDNQAVELLMAFPDYKIGIREGSANEANLINDWKIWECNSEEQARIALRQIADVMQIKPNVLRLDFNRLDSLIKNRQLEMAENELFELQDAIYADHPDWGKCEGFRKKLRKLKSQVKHDRVRGQREHIIPTISFIEVLKRDAERLKGNISSNLPEHCIFGLFSPLDESNRAVDAVWVAEVTAEEVVLWSACLEGNRAYLADSSWEVFESEPLLLQKLIDNINNKTVFTWDLARLWPTLQNWHYRVKGQHLPNSTDFVDFKGITQIAFPLIYRNDSPENFCKQSELVYVDDMGVGGPLAAMSVLLNETRSALNGLPDEFRSTLRELFSMDIDSNSDGHFLFSRGHELPTGLPVPKKWLDIFLPEPKTGLNCSYLELLHKRFKELPPLVQISSGKNDCSNYSVTDFLKKGGIIDSLSDFDYHERKDQIAFSLEVEEAFKETLPYVLEAGTGIGKTLGYLIPAFLSGKKIMVATNTKALQDQAWEKDIPLVMKALSTAGIECTATIIKGKGNYVCLQTIADILEEPQEYLYSINDYYSFCAILSWLLATKTGWLSEVEHFNCWRILGCLGRDTAPPKLLDKWAEVDPHSCAKNAAIKSDLLITNHSYVFALVKSITDIEKLDFDALILDEAHNVDDVVTEVLTEQFRPWVLMNEYRSLLKRDTNGVVRGLYAALYKQAGLKKYEEVITFTTLLDKSEILLSEWCYSAQKRLCDMYVNLTEYDPDRPSLFLLDKFWINPLRESAKELLNSLRALSSASRALLDEIHQIKGLPRRLPGSLSSLEEHICENAVALANLLGDSESDINPNECVRWAEANVSLDFNGKPLLDNDILAWKSIFYNTPLDIAKWLKEKVNSVFKHRIYLSATMSVNGDFSAILERLGLKTDDTAKKPITKNYPSPFDYKKQALLAVPHDMPLADYRLKVDPLYLEELAEHLASLAKIGEGCTLALFTSRLIMQEMKPRLQPRLDESEIIVLTQDDANRSALVERLREAPKKGEKVVLLGLKAFWEGIDIPGSALKILVVTKLPFAYHGHPVQEAKQIYFTKNRFDYDYFYEQVVPSVYLHLRQMYGRLIRSESDFGATVITDPRIYFRSYGRHLLKNLPQSTVVVDKKPIVVESVERFLNGEEIESAFTWGDLSFVEYDLSPQQKAILVCPSKRILVRAAAGSGKTRVLIARMISLIENKKANPDDILALTFTNKGVEVMQERIETAIGPDSYRLNRNILTYHRLAMRIINEDNKQNEQITQFIDEGNPDVEERLFDQVRNIVGLTAKQLSNDNARTMISYAQNGLINEEELRGIIPDWQNDNPLMAKYAAFYLAYCELIRSEQKLDYGEAIVRAVRILREKPDQTAKWRNRFKWIFCDEYQDTSPAQAMLLQLLGQQANLFVVGDNAQSIYSWQGSDPNNLRRFELDFPNTSTFQLSKNYRCFPKLVRMSNRFLEKNGQSFGIRIEYDEKRSTEEQEVYYLKSNNDYEEAAVVAKLAKKALEINIPGDPPPVTTVGILARKWILLNNIEYELIKHSVPYKYEGDTAKGLLTNTIIKDIIRRAVKSYKRSRADDDFGDTAEGKLAEQIQNGSIKLVVQLLRLTKESLPGKEMPDFDLESFNKLCSILGDRELDVLLSLDNEDNSTPVVVLSTIHSQKGEEFDTVFVLGLEKGNTPNQAPPEHQMLIDWRKIVQSMSYATWRAGLTDRDLEKMYGEEESRIFYVAMTRAKYNLVICWAEERTLQHKKVYKKSKYLDQAYENKIVSEATSEYEVSIVEPSVIAAPLGYRSDGRIFQTNARVLVRSKSEMLLANEFNTRGMYFEYEEPDENVPWALPDFIFPDYSNAILEHLGLLADVSYFERWEEKAKTYEDKGIMFLQTNESEIKNLGITVNRLQEQFAEWVSGNLGNERLILIRALEELRQISKLPITRSIGPFDGGIFGVDDQEIVAISLTKDDFQDEILDYNAPTILIPPGVDNIRGAVVTWQKREFGKYTVWIARAN